MHCSLTVLATGLTSCSRSPQNQVKDLPWSHTHTTNSYLECYTANRKVFPVLQHAQIFSDQCCWVDQALGGFSMIASFRVFSSHVLKPSQSQVWRGLVALGNSNQNRNASQSGGSSESHAEFTRQVPATAQTCHSKCLNGWKCHSIRKESLWHLKWALLLWVGVKRQGTLELGCSENYHI